MAKRKDERIKKKLMVSFDDEGAQTLGLTDNISKFGMQISSSKSAGEKQEIIVSIAVPGEVFELKGEVIWCNESGSGNNSIPESMGIKIISAPAEYLNYIEYVKHQRIKKGEPEI